MIAETGHYINTYNLGDFIRKEFYQVLGIMMCFVFLLFSGALVFFQFEWGVRSAAFLSFFGLLFYTIMTLEFLMAINFFSIGYGYYVAWIGAISIGLGSELNREILS